jgi:hypothetical protein
MKVLAGIPTRLRDTSGKIADTLAEVCNEVVVVSQGATCTSRKSNVNIVEKPVDFGLIPARNYILQYALDGDFDLVIESDDDLAYSAETVDYMIQTLDHYPTLGSLASASRPYFHWDDAVKCNQCFLLAPCANQLWAVRTPIVKEIGLMDLDYLEDREYGARLWEHGYAVAILHIDLQHTHNPFVSRTKFSVGGQDKGELRKKMLGAAMVILQQTYPNMLKISPVQAENRTFMTRYNWSYMMRKVIDRFGYALGYEDSKGRKL